MQIRDIRRKKERFENSHGHLGKQNSLHPIRDSLRFMVNYTLRGNFFVTIIVPRSTFVLTVIIFFSDRADEGKFSFAFYVTLNVFPKVKEH